MTDQILPVEWVSLGEFDVDPADLTRPGQPWDGVVPGESASTIPSGLIAVLPGGGWREVTLEAPTQGERLFAAPGETGWFTAHLSPTGVLSASDEPARLRPGKATRRRGLTLTVNTTGVTSLDDLTATLTNSSTEPWTADPDDSGVVHGHITRDGEPVDGGWFAYATLSQQLHDLQPGGSLELPIAVAPKAHEIAPGTYEVTAVLLSHSLCSAPAEIVLPAGAQVPGGNDDGGPS
jgi:hypothetical protein